MPLSHESCSNLRLSLGEIEAKHAKLVALLAEINNTGTHKLFIEAVELKRQIELDFETIPFFKTIEFLKTIEGEYTIHHFDLEPKTGDQYLAELKTAGMPLWGEAEYLLKIMPMLKKQEQFEIIIIKIRDLGFTSNPTKDEVYKKAKELGLEICPPQIGPEYRLKYRDQIMNNWVFIGMEPIIDQGGYSRVFSVGHDGGDLVLDASWAVPSNRWNLDDHIAFRLSK